MVMIAGKLKVRICTLCRKPGQIGWLKYKKMENNKRKCVICTPTRCYHGMKAKPSIAKPFKQAALIVDQIKFCGTQQLIIHTAASL
eukprot:284261-Prymnesium_polylepis.1